ncbi:ras association domain-containing protein 8 [Neodiprion pinetum]|uniref:ras association domain-containing protein 8 n=1 Tax=Neodiprion fabricii TaxID=2872261 RepID=UPI00076FDBDD|nr:ras association domain-containing protein 8 [Neodiprion fabricii]XP_046420878.1 ras association domain-containing protein 8 [Neodiprion fabricii]XP_046420879.1 ras association domain-containing protein 8 [Neodiprion fabricii]XP_046478908.1 ras association domain-containing protein 8 [Neodiprion pinetum]XP_046478909.1 ras association domain-containing protein 8 [Neodiprion pinetum]XP_046478910.1 ras association domain-containing protein 8 [Neodiprion pinetum]XP_046616508.1 ras association d
MELKVWVEGFQRIVCGVTETTTCQDVVYALAHATGQTGRFTLVERWRNNERLLAPYENPLKILLKWGEYSSEVQLILRRSSDGNKPQGTLGARCTQRSHLNGLPSSHPEGTYFKEGKLSGAAIQEWQDFTRNPTVSNSPEVDEPKGLERNRDIRTSLTFGGLCSAVPENTSEVQMENVAIVQPTQQLKSKEPSAQKVQHKPSQSPNRAGSSEYNATYMQQRKVREVPPYRDPPGLVSALPRTLPPYREPPPPNLSSPSRSQFSPLSSGGSPQLQKDGQSSPNNSTKLKRNLFKEFHEQKSQTPMSNPVPSQPQSMMTVAYTQRYVELVRLVNRQRDTINAQQADLTKYDAEILYFETKNKEQVHQMDYISHEVNRFESTGRMLEEQLKELAHVEEESEIVRQQEKTLKSEITLLRSKLANCETELLQCKNKIRLVIEELASEQHAMSREVDERKIMERKIIGEVEHLQSEVEHAKRSAELVTQCAESLKLEVASLESTIVEKKVQVERLVADMKEANLQSLAVASQDDQIKHLLEGALKPGSTRKMIGSPRQLETAVPTSKNPHGVWV